MAEITSLHNPRIKSARRLRDRRGREDQGRIIIDGYREVKSALQARVQLLEAYIANDSRLAAADDLLQHDLAAAGVQVFLVPRHVFQAICFGQRTGGIVAVAEPPIRSLQDIPATRNVLLAILECAEKPGNIGAIVRSADGAGVSAMIVADPATDLFNPNVIRASLGTIFTLPVCCASSRQTVTWLEQTGTRVYVARLADAVDYESVDYQGRVAIVLGSESEGVSDMWKSPQFQGVKLPMCGSADSLNVSAAAAILFYEAQRQRRACEIRQ
jgi:TrmH family RNA methyltransferase